MRESHKRANRKWDNAHKDRINYLNRRSTAKNFILKSATEDDLTKLADCISQRQDMLQYLSKLCPHNLEQETLAMKGGDHHEVV